MKPNANILGYGTENNGYISNCKKTHFSITTLSMNVSVSYFLKAWRHKKYSVK